MQASMAMAGLDGSILMGMCGFNDFRTPCRNPVEDVGEGPGGPLHYFGQKKKKLQKEENVAGQTKQNCPPPPPPS